MSAEALGASLLREMKVEGLDDILRTLRFRHETHGARTFTSVPSIDKLLNAFCPPTVTQHHQDPVLELVGSSPCSGKKQILYALIARSLLPSNYDGTSLGGRSSAVILFDLGNNFSLLRLRDVMTSNIRTSINEKPLALSTTTITNIIHTSLSHLHIFRPQSSSSLLTTLSTLPTYILNPTSHLSSNRQIGAIILTNLDSFLHQDRFSTTTTTTALTKTPPPSSTLLSHNFHTLTSHLRNLQHTFSTPIIATTTSLSPPTSHLPAPWRHYVTLRLILSREPTLKFPHGISAEEASKQAGQRREAVAKSVFTARVDWSGSEGWREDVRERVKGIEFESEGRGFAFRVTNDGVEVLAS